MLLVQETQSVFISTHNETLSVAMRVHNPDCLPLKILCRLVRDEFPPVPQHFEDVQRWGPGYDAHLKTIGPVRAETPFTVVVAPPQGSVAKFGG